MRCSALPKTKRRTGATPIADLLVRMGLCDDVSLALHLPLRYEDETRITPINQAQPGIAAQFQVVVVRQDIQYRPRRQLVIQVEDASGTMTVRLIHFYPNMIKTFAPGQNLRLFGEVRAGFFGIEILHPRVQAGAPDTPLPECLTPVYPSTAGLSQRLLRQRIRCALDRVDWTDTLPETLRERFHLLPLEDSVRFLHHPPASVSLADLQSRVHPAWRRIAFDELLAQQISLRHAHELRRTGSAPILAGHSWPAALLESLPFSLTFAQQRAWQEIAQDIAQPHPMHRLLQGDVGSGKTVIAALALLAAAQSGYQAALMAPTEILAEQHFMRLSAWFAPLGAPVVWLSGAMRASEKAAVSSQLAQGDVLLAVGTHALIEERVDFERLALAIVDEQHRFGVRQRLALKQKGWQAHQLAMSATPIPRTLAMSIYADMDVSTLDELPPGRQPVRTKLMRQSRRAEVIARVARACESGRQAYWVCPLIEESEALQLEAATQTWERLQAELPHLRVGLLHGRMRPAEKTAVMAEFVGKAVHVLVATSVIEVGVDVPNAGLMVIEEAQRFGLAQLHQLRGRVGRGCDESVCILLYGEPMGDMARQRLKAIYEHHDGFEIARLDLAQRGPGEFVGSRQSGLPLLRFACLDDPVLIENVRLAADILLREFPAIAHKHVQRWLAGRVDLLKA
jgi:ATP-dependent DNA helicase RecG